MLIPVSVNLFRLHSPVWEDIISLKDESSKKQGTDTNPIVLKQVRLCDFEPFYYWIANLYVNTL